MAQVTPPAPLSTLFRWPPTPRQYQSLSCRSPCGMGERSLLTLLNIKHHPSSQSINYRYKSPKNTMELLHLGGMLPKLQPFWSALWHAGNTWNIFLLSQSLGLKWDPVLIKIVRRLPYITKSIYRHKTALHTALWL